MSDRSLQRGNENVLYETTDEGTWRLSQNALPRQLRFLSLCVVAIACLTYPTPALDVGDEGCLLLVGEYFFTNNQQPTTPTFCEALNNLGFQLR